MELPARAIQAAAEQRAAIIARNLVPPRIHTLPPPLTVAYAGPAPLAHAALPTLGRKEQGARRFLWRSVGSERAVLTDAAFDEAIPDTRTTWRPWDGRSLGIPGESQPIPIRPPATLGIRQLSQYCAVRCLRQALRNSFPSTMTGSL
jgi:hypothetical protein